MRFLLKKSQVILIVILLLIWLFFSYYLLLCEIPSTVKVNNTTERILEKGLPVTCSRKTLDSEEAVSVQENFTSKIASEYTVKCKLFGVIPIKEVTVMVEDTVLVYPSGRVIGIYGHTEGVMVQKIATVRDYLGNECSPAKGKLQTGDYIIMMDDEPITGKEELMEKIDASDGQEVCVTFLRDGCVNHVKITPVCSQKEDYLLGIWVKDDLAGIGTMTYYTKEGDYGALGHGMGDGESKNLLFVSEGAIYDAKVNGVTKSVRNKPGELEGIVFYGSKHLLGTINENQKLGVFGCIDHNVLQQYLKEDQEYEIAYKQEIETDYAFIFSDYSGVRNAYKILITDIDYSQKNSNKCLTFEVMDERLLEETGGIVQGMSGSPIIQNGKIIGAVTHVFVQEPNRGYGIFIEEML